MMQHSLPSMISKCRPESKMKPTLLTVFSVSLFSILVISYLGMGAFGGAMAVNF
jgi:amino acid permease